MKKIFKAYDDFVMYLRNSSVDAYAGQIAYFTILSFIPLLILFITITNNIPIIKDAYQEIIEDYIPNSFMPVLKDVLADAFSRTKAAVSISIVFTAWTAAKSIQAMTNGLNSVYGIKNTKPWIILRGKAVINTILYLLIICVLLFAILFGNEMQELIHKYIPQIDWFAGITNNRFWIGNIFVVVTCISFYKYLPEHKVSFLSQIPGAVLAGVSAIGLSYALSIYVNKFNGFSMYGSLTSLILIMMWLYLIMYIVLLGAALNHYFFAKIFNKRKNRSHE